jgi:phage nucleotide-binding protein
MAKVAKPEELQKAKVLVFAPGGAGKTTFLGSAQDDPRTSPMLILDFEGGTGSLAGLDIDVVPIRTWDDYNEVFENLAEGNTDEEGVDYSKYKSIGIDSISETHTWALLDILDVEGASRRDPELLEQRDYGKASVQMRRLLRSFRDLPLHVFYTSNSKEVEMSRVGKVAVPSLAGQMAEEVVGLMDVVGYMAQSEDEDGNAVRMLLLQNYPKFRTKARTPWGVTPPDELEDPSITSLLDTLGYPAPDKPKTRGRKKAEETSD